MPQIAREEQYSNYLLGVSSDFNALPVPVTKYDGKLYRLCRSRRDSGNTPETNAIEQVISNRFIASEEITEVLNGN